MLPRGTAMLEPRSVPVVSGLVVNADNQTTTAFELPNEAAEFNFIVQVTAVSGTTPTLVAALQHSPDQGTTWTFTGNNSAHTGVSISSISFSRLRHSAQAAATFSADPPAVGAAAAAQNGPVMRKCRFIFRVGGTTPSFTINIWMQSSVLV